MASTSPNLVPEVLASVWPVDAVGGPSSCLFDKLCRWFFSTMKADNFYSRQLTNVCWFIDMDICASEIRFRSMTHSLWSVAFREGHSPDYFAQAKPKYSLDANDWKHHKSHCWMFCKSPLYFPCICSLIPEHQGNIPIWHDCTCVRWWQWWKWWREGGLKWRSALVMHGKGSDLHRSQVVQKLVWSLRI